MRTTGGPPATETHTRPNWRTTFRAIYESDMCGLSFFPTNSAAPQGHSTYSGYLS